MKKIIVIYMRVSSAAQSLELQETAAKRYLESIDLSGDEETIIYLSDYDVSATKLKMDQRPKLVELISLIKEFKVEKLIVYKRDRLARNFYEFVDLTKIFIKYNVEVVYTASNEPPFKNKLALEAFYGMFGQLEGENIRTRTNDARKQYPSRLFGYTRIKEDDQARFQINEDKKDVILSLFEDFSNVQDGDQFLNFLMVKRKGLNNPEKLFRILSNPFYAGHYETKSGYQILPHVTPIIDLDLFLKGKSKLDEYFSYYQKSLEGANNQFLVLPNCEKCGNVMKHRRENVFDIGNFVCSNNHKRLSITVEELNSLVKQTLLEHIQSISAKHLKSIISKRIISENKRLQKELEITKSEFLDNSLTLSTIDVKRKPAIAKLLDKLQSLKDKYNDLEQDLLSLQKLREEILEIRSLLTPLTLDLTLQDLQRLSELLIDKVKVYETYVHVELFLSSFDKEDRVS
ncbi:recombinase family protein [Lysinibacillus sp. OL1_EC]|uniref:recombinase family protein n=1 Tax=unclassified Lysinibacillus TaxID=2636778 RepID=UPI00103B8474|nr:MULTISPECIES: recombinase family protein [unclassified Lysinibacillus]MCM0626618.1 recombinase family protein [Lysinibacillus sp. OL1_EC]TBV85884.1 recombinase family protein [Lysinibacillus sp. OL1]